MLRRTLNRFSNTSILRCSNIEIKRSNTVESPKEPNILVVKRAANESEARQSNKINKILKDQGYNCKLLRTENFKSIQVSFPSLSSLFKAHMHVNSVGYNSYIYRESVHKTFPYSKNFGLPFAKPTTKIEFVDEESKVEAICNTLEKEAQTNDSCVLGLDCEWKPSWAKGEVNPISVIQLSSSNTTAVIHLSVLQKGHKVLPPALEKLLTNKGITKIVVDNPDIIRLYNEYNINVNHLDLQKMPISYRLGTISLSGMSEIFFKQMLSKSEGRTNWEQPSLTVQQITYAALDAELTRRLYFSIKDLPID